MLYKPIKVLLDLICIARGSFCFIIKCKKRIKGGRRNISFYIKRVSLRSHLKLFFRAYNRLATS